MKQKLENIIESLLLSSSRPLSESEILRAFEEGDNVTISDIKEALSNLKELYSDRSFELVKVANGFRLKIRQNYSPWISKLWESKPQKYSRAMMETLALIAYKQPLTRGEIEEVRGVSVSSQIIRTLLDRNWIKVVGHRDVPGRPALLATTKDFLDDLDISKLSDLPDLPDIGNLPKEVQMPLLIEDPQEEVPSIQE
jgi:segregation and condensation protein B